jgi:TonB family protein
MSFDFAAAAAALLIAAPPAANPPCPYSISFAAYDANGTQADYAEYVAYVQGGKGDAYAATFTLGTANGATPVTVDVSVPDARSSPARLRPAILFVTHRPDVAWIRLASVSVAGEIEYDDCTKPYPIPQILWTVTPTFDDSAAWIVKGGVTAVVISAPNPTTLLEPDYPAQARKRDLQGTCVVAVDVSADGDVDDAELVSSSGSPLLDAIAVKAALGNRFEPAMLPKSAGGSAIGSALEITFTFSPGMVTVRDR